MKSTYLTEILFSTTVLRLDFTAITVQLTHGGACASHGNPDETCDLVELTLKPLVALESRELLINCWNSQAELPKRPHPRHPYDP